MNDDDIWIDINAAARELSEWLMSLPIEHVAQGNPLLSNYQAAVKNATDRLNDLVSAVGWTWDDLTEREFEILASDQIAPDEYLELPRLLFGGMVVHSDKSNEAFTLLELNGLGCEVRAVVRARVAATKLMDTPPQS